MKKTNLFIGILFALTVSIFGYSFVNAQSLTGDSPIGGGTTLGGSGAFGDGTGGGGYSYDPGNGPTGSDGGPIVTVPGSGQYSSTPNDKPSGYCVDAPSAPFKNIPEVIKFVTCTILQFVVPLLFAVALAVFVWGTVKFISANDSAEKEQGRQFMLWGVIALAVMLSVWSLTAVLNNTFGLRTVIPQLPVNKNVQ